MIHKTSGHVNDFQIECCTMHLNTAIKHIYFRAGIMDKQSDYKNKTVFRVSDHMISSMGH